MNTHPAKALFVNVFGALGYIFCLALWGWTGMQYAPMLLENKHVEQIFIPPQGEPVVTPQAPTMPPTVAIALAAIITAVVLVTTIIVILKAPKTIARTGKTVTQKAASSALPLITKRQKLTPAKKQRLTAGLIKLAKLLLVILPVAIGFLGTFIELPLPFDLAIFISSALAICALLCFSAQYVAARLLGVNQKLLI